MSLLILIFLLHSVLIEATVNVCIPLKPPKHQNQYDVLNDITNDIRERPAGNPIFIEEIYLNISHPAINVVGPLNNVTILNFLDFQLCALDNYNNETYEFDLFNVTFHNLTVTGMYNISGDIGDIFDIYGAGPFWISLENFSIAIVNFSIKVADEICFPIDVQIAVQSVDNNFTDFMFDDDLSELFNKCIKGILPEILPIIWTDIQNAFDGPLQKEIDDIFGRHDISSLLQTVLENSSNDENERYCSPN